MSVTRATRVAIDIGGTFTDFVVLDAETGRFRVGKVLTTPANPVEAVVRGLQRLEVDLSRVEFFVHGTTVGLNAVVEGRGADVALITTKGFRDVLEIARMEKKEMYNLFYERPKPLVPRRHRHEVDERVDGFGEVLRPVDADEVRALVEQIRDSGIESVAVATINAYVNPENERALGDLVQEALGTSFVSVSHEVVNEWREYERTSTTVLNAYVLPVFQRYLSEIGDRLSDLGLEPEVHIMKSNGGIMTASAAIVSPVHSLLSGPVGGSVGAQAVAGRNGTPGSARMANVVTADMGGTSFDASLIIGGELDTTTQSSLAGHPLLVPSARVSAIGAGGGSIARVEGSGSLRVGPESAGASPGPVAYRNGGTEPTVTDANVVLGRLDPEGVLAGEIALDVEGARRAIQEKVAGPLGLGVEEAAEGILAVIDNKMALAIRELTIAQGLDPGDFVMVAYGGAGPMHAAAICEEIGVPRVVVPAVPGMFSAWGMLTADVRHDVVRTSVNRAAELEPGAIEAVFQELEVAGREELRGQDVPDQAASFLHTLDMRYQGQEHTLSVSVRPDVDPRDLKRLFDEAYQRKYGHHSAADPVEVVNFRVAAIGRVPKPEAARLVSAGADATPSGEREVYFNGAFASTPVYDRTALGAGIAVSGPLVVEEDGATTIVPPGFELTVDDYGNLVLTKEGSADGR
ncbi:MAG: N-methylhydantoinase [Gaiellales bacterium]|jgi:N-methylhydantoinase A|nr:N-methylhydantoinase [Gaiellales bacterium]